MKVYLFVFGRNNGFLCFEAPSDLVLDPIELDLDGMSKEELIAHPDQFYLIESQLVMKLSREPNLNSWHLKNFRICETDEIYMKHRNDDESVHFLGLVGANPPE